MKNIGITLLIISLMASVSGAAQVQKPSELKYPPLQYDPPNPKEFRTTFDCGLIGYVQEDHELPIFNISALINFGGLYVPQDKLGLSEIMSEILIKGGTKTLEGSVIEERISFLGGSLSFRTGERMSTLSLSVLREDLDEGLGLFFDVLMNPAFRDDALELARVGLIQRLRQANDQPGSVLSREYERLIYGDDHLLTRQPNRATYEGITAADLKAVHSAFFFPKNIILAASGDFSKSELKAKIDKFTAGWQNRKASFPVLSKKFPQPEPGVYFIQNEINQGYISLGHLGIEETNPDYPALQVMNFILGGGSFSSRITMKVRSDEGLSYNQGSRFTTRWGFPGTFAGYVQTKSSTVGYAISLIQAEFERIRKEPVSDDEMDTAVNYYLESFSNVFESPQGTMSTFAELEMTGMPMDYYAAYRDKIRSVTKEKVKEVANTYIHPDRMVIVIVGDFEPCNAGGDQWPGPLDKLGKVHMVTLKNPMTGEVNK